MQDRTRSELASKVDDVRSHFAPVVGRKLIGYETAELLLHDGTWTSWPDLPIRLHLSGDKLVAISWSGFDDLWIANDLSLPFPIEDATVRWLSNSMANLNDILNTTIGSVLLGKGGMTWESREIEIWTRVLIQTGDRWLEIFNALDENGYALHAEMPEGNFIRCV